jgi:hypothetical protein
MGQTMKTEIISPWLSSIDELLDEMRKETDPKCIIASIDSIISNLRMLRKMADMELKKLAFYDGRDL